MFSFDLGKNIYTYSPPQKCLDLLGTQKNFYFSAKQSLIKAVASLAGMPWFESQQDHFCVESACSPRVWCGFL